MDKPVLMVPPDAHPRDSLQRVVVAMEGTPRKARSVKRAVEVAASAGLELVVVHVDDEASIPLFSDQIQHETDAYAREFLARYCRGAPEARLVLRIGNPAEEILATSETIAPDLLEIGWPHSSDPERGMVAREIVDRSPTPVLLVAVA
jgi:nucleotide-binding universal stress UspA family protein